MRRSQKRKKDSHIKQLFVHSGSACIKTVRKHVDEIDPRMIIALSLSKFIVNQKKKKSLTQQVVKIDHLNIARLIFPRLRQISYHDCHKF